MAKLAEMTVVRRDGQLLNPPTTMYFNTNWHTVSADPISYVDAAGITNTGTAIQTAWYDGTDQHQFIANEAPSTIRSRMNAANTTDVHVISLTRKNRDGSTTNIVPQLDHILLAQKHPEDNADALVWLQNATNSVVDTIKTDETAAAIATAANA